MSTPVISKKDQRRSLSAKKGPIKGLRNVLAQPYENYWPILKNDSELEILMKKDLMVLKKTSKSIPWSELRTMNKEERFAARRAMQNVETTVDENDKGAYVVFGINAVTRALETKKLCCVLLDANVDPSLLVKHIVQMAQKQNIPILLTSFLKKITTETVGFSSAAMGLKHIVQKSEENHFYALYEKISLLFKELPKPNSSKLPVALFKKKAECDNSLINDVETNTEKCSDNFIELENSPVLLSNIQLHRSSKKERMFVPPTLQHGQEDQEKLIDTSCSDYIALDKDENIQLGKADSSSFRCRKRSSSDSSSDENEVKKKPSKHTSKEEVKPSAKKLKFSGQHEPIYVPLKVRKIKGNAFRTKATKQTNKKKK